MIGTPNTGQIRIETVISLIPALFTTIGYYKQLGEDAPMFGLVFPVGCYVYINRNICVTQAVETNASHLFFVDADVEFPPDTLVKLLHADKDIIGATYNKRSWPPRPILDIRKEDMPDGLCKSNAMPTGVLLIKTDVFRKITQPWFAYQFTEGQEEWVGEDIYFCRKATQAGFEIWCDPTIDVKHIGEYKY